MDEQILNDQQVENNPEETSEQAGEEAQEQEQAEETQEQAGEEILSEEEREIQREIEAYQAKIEQLDERLNEFKSVHIEALKRKQMEARFYSEEQIGKYVAHIEGETVEEIDRSILELAEKVPPANDNFADPSPFNGRAAKPKPIDHAEIGRQAFERIKHKIFPWMRS